MGSNKNNKNSAEGGIAPAGAKVTGATIRTWLINKFISILAVLSWKTGLKENADNLSVGHIYSQPVPFPLVAISPAFCIMKSMVVVGFKVAEIWYVDINCLEVTGAQNVGQGHWIKVPAVNTSRKKH